MSRRLALTATTVVMAALAIAPAHAAGPKVVNGSYKVTLTPDPTQEATGLAGDGCQAVIPAAVDNHKLSVPGAGTLSVTLDAPDPAGSAQTDWDLWILAADGTILDGSHGESSHEETTDKFKAKSNVTIQVCNLAGAPDGTVTYTFTPKK